RRMADRKNPSAVLKKFLQLYTRRRHAVIDQNQHVELLRQFPFFQRVLLDEREGKLEFLQNISRPARWDRAAIAVPEGNLRLPQRKRIARRFCRDRLKRQSKFLSHTLKL